MTSQPVFTGLKTRLEPAGFLPVFTGLKSFLNRPNRTGLKFEPVGPDRFEKSGPVTTLPFTPDAVVIGPTIESQRLCIASRTFVRKRRKSHSGTLEILVL